MTQLILFRFKTSDDFTATGLTGHKRLVQADDAEAPAPLFGGGGDVQQENQQPMQEKASAEQIPMEDQHRQAGGKDKEQTGNELVEATSVHVPA
jgi:hypothetical protein